MAPFLARWTHFFAPKMTVRHKMTPRQIAGRVQTTLSYAGLFSALLIGSRVDQKDEVNAHLPTVRLQRLAQQSSYAVRMYHTGDVQAKRRSAIGFQRGGKVVEVLVDEGSEVRQGVPLARLDDRRAQSRFLELQAQLASARAVMSELENGTRQETLQAARARLSDVQQSLERETRDLERTKRLFQQNAVSRQEFERVLYRVRELKAREKVAQSELDELVSGPRDETKLAQEATVTSIEAALKNAKHDVDDSCLKAPFDGIITRRQVDEGIVVQPGQTVVELLEHRKLEVHVGLPVALAAALQVGQDFNVTIGATTLKSKLSTIVRMVDPATRTRKAIFTLPADAAERGVVAGQIARIEFLKPEQKQGFWIPVTAVIRDQRGLWSCFVFEPGTANAAQGQLKKHAVEILHQDSQRVYVRGTLRDGQWLVVDGLHRLADRQRVRAMKGNN